MAAAGEEWFGLENASRRKKEAQELYEEAKRLVNEEESYALALKKLKEAYRLVPLQKYKKRIDELISFMRSEDISFVESFTENIENFETSKISLSSGLKVKRNLYEKLYGYQVEGVEWLHRHFLKTDGCILADDMGLGKTIQTIALIASLIESKSIRSVLIVAPTTLLLNWGREFHTWASDIKVFKFDGSLSIASRLRALLYVQEEGGVLLCTYDLCRNFSEQISSCRDRYFVWDYLILDEGHKIKNATKTTRSIHEIPSRNRLLLTGTPLQNNLRELWALYDFVMKGTLLGSYHTFKVKFETPIMRGREKDARNREIVQGRKTAESLRQIYSPYFLRRTKNEVFKGKNSAVKLPRKIDWVVWIYLSEAQISVYKDFLNSDDVKQLILRGNMKSALVSLLVLKKICDHPRLLSQGVCNEILNNANLSTENIDDDGVSIANVSDQQLIKESSKLSFCLYLLEKLKEDGHKTLLFSQSTKMLDIIQQILLHRNWKLSRLDGRVVNMRKRDGIIRAFQTDASIPLCLLTSQVGGVGLTLTSADRVIIYDPCWNPATDSQAIDRAYRIGQQRDVVVYRLVSCGSVEEKIYKRQIFKDSITKQTVGAEKDPTRYFTGADLRQLFEFSDPKVSNTFELISEIHGSDFNYNQSTVAHLQSVKSSPDVLDVHDHNVLFSNEEPEVVEEVEVINLIDNEVNMARENLVKESQSTKQALVESGAFARPFELHVSDKRAAKTPENYVQLDNPSEVIEIRDSLPNDAAYFSFVEEFSDVQIIDDSITNAVNQQSSFTDSKKQEITTEGSVVSDDLSYDSDDSLCKLPDVLRSTNPEIFYSDTENKSELAQKYINGVVNTVENKIAANEEEEEEKESFVRDCIKLILEGGETEERSIVNKSLNDVSVKNEIIEEKLEGIVDDEFLNDMCISVETKKMRDTSGESSLVNSQTSDDHLAGEEQFQGGVDIANVVKNEIIAEKLEDIVDDEFLNDMCISVETKKMRDTSRESSLVNSQTSSDDHLVDEEQFQGGLDIPNVVKNEIIEEKLEQEYENEMSLVKNEVLFFEDDDDVVRNEMTQDVCHATLSDSDDSLCRVPDIFKKRRKQNVLYSDTESEEVDVGTSECLNDVLQSVDNTNDFIKESNGATHSQASNMGSVEEWLYNLRDSVVEIVEREIKGKKVDSPLKMLKSEKCLSVLSDVSDNFGPQRVEESMNISNCVSDILEKVEDSMNISNCVSDILEKVEDSINISNCVSDILENVEDSMNISNCVSDILEKVEDNMNISNCVSDILENVEDSMNISNCVSDILEKVEDKERSGIVDDLLSDVLTNVESRSITAEARDNFQSCVSRLFEDTEKLESTIDLDSRKRRKQSKEPEKSFSSCDNLPVIKRCKRRSGFEEQWFEISEAPTDENAFALPLMTCDQSTPNRILRIPLTVPSTVTRRKPLKPLNDFEISDIEFSLM